MKIFNVRAKDNLGSALWKSRSGEYQILEYHGMPPILLGYDYTLVRKDYIAPFKRLANDQVEITETLVTRRLTGETWEDYFSLYIPNEISQFTIDACKKSNNSIWFFPGGLMVSSKLMRELQRKGNDLIFREGFGGYA